MKDGLNITSIGLLSILMCTHNYTNKRLATNLYLTESLNISNITTDALQMLYVHQRSENEAVLMTIEQFGITQATEGNYTCLAMNNLTEAEVNVFIDVLGNYNYVIHLSGSYTLSLCIYYRRRSLIS